MTSISAFHYADIPLTTRPGSKYPLHKFPLLVDGALTRFASKGLTVSAGTPASLEYLELCHSIEYIRKIQSGPLSEQEERELGFCWSDTLFTRGATIVGCALAALSSALEIGISCTLGGGAHHAFADRGRGFCIFNDVATISLHALLSGAASRVAVLDCDVHQGDGTASILKHTPSVFTCSIHGAKNYPFRKEQSSLDIELDDDCGDHVYLEALDRALQESLYRFEPDLLVYIAGADPYREDTLGRLKVSAEALALRDSRIFKAVSAYEIPTVVLFGGGYCVPIEKTVAVNLKTIEIALGVWRLS